LSPFLQVLQEIESQLLKENYGSSGILLYCNLKLKTSQLNLSLMQQQDDSAVVVMDQLLAHVGSRVKVGHGQ
jgi:hypothetical protein